jgi:hypothetical protein
VYVNGIGGTPATVVDGTPWGETLYIGTAIQGSPFNGLIDELRVSKGVALYSANFTPATSAFPDPATVPDVVGNTLTAGTAALLSAGVFLGSVSSIYSTVPANLIISQSEVGAGFAGDTIDLVVSLGPAPSGAPSGAAYANRITSEHNQKPNFMAVVALLTNGIGDIVEATQAITPAFDLDQAVGNQLDIIGLWVGQPRVIETVLVQGFFGFSDDTAALPFGELTDPSIGGVFYELGSTAAGSTTLNDAVYLTILKAAIVRNQSSGTRPAIEAALMDIFGVPCSVADNGTLSLAITIPVPVSPTDEALLTALDILPRPAGVAIGSITYTP